MLTHQTKNTRVQIVAMSPTGHRITNPAFHLWACIVAVPLEYLCLVAGAVV